MLVSNDPDDQANIFLEIRAGTGGDEAALFVNDLLRMYLKFSEKTKMENRNNFQKARAKLEDSKRLFVKFQETMFIQN